MVRQGANSTGPAAVLRAAARRQALAPAPDFLCIVPVLDWLTVCGVRHALTARGAARAWRRVPSVARAMTLAGKALGLPWKAVPAAGDIVVVRAGGAHLAGLALDDTLSGVVTADGKFIAGPWPVLRCWGVPCPR